jgi:hypothetical protein
MSIKAEEDALRLQEADGLISLSCDGDVSLRVPAAASISVAKVEGDMSLRGVAGALEVQEVLGDLSMRDVESVEVGKVHSDFSLRGASGTVHVTAVDGDAAARDVLGHVQFDSIADCLVLREVGGGLMANVGEDAVIYLSPRPGQTYSITAGDDILLALPPSADATLTMNGDSIHVHWEGVKQEQSTSRELTLGSGAASIRLNAGGEVRVTDQADAGAWADEHGNLAGINFDWSGLGEQIARRAEAAVRRVEQKAASAVRRAERTVTRKTAGWQAGRPASSPFPAQAASPGGASEAERLSILRMLELKKITAEEAELLLAALE